MGWTHRSLAVSVQLQMDEHRKQAGLKLVRLRDARGWNQEDLAHHANVSVKTVSRFENGRHDGRRSTIEKLAKALRVRPETLTGAVSVPSPSELEHFEARLDQVMERLDELRDLLEPREAVPPLPQALEPSDEASSPERPNIGQPQKSRAAPRRPPS